jgi:alkaline phosphatase D
MSEASNRREFLLKTAATVAAVGAVAACGGGDSVSPAQFAYGVASGDPLADRVILWTHAKIPGSNAAVPLTWEVASDSSFKTIVSTGKVETLEANAFTAKVDATGLAAGNTYFYRFHDAAGQCVTCWYNPHPAHNQHHLTETGGFFLLALFRRVFQCVCPGRQI